jgi:hypothetical protein
MKQKIIKFNNKKYRVWLRGEITKSKKTRRKKYHKCLICSETRYVQRHHIRPGLTIPLCPLHHSATHIGDVDIMLIEE